MASLARRDHRKSKFGLRHDIKLIELENLRNPARVRRAGAMRGRDARAWAPVSYQSSTQYALSSYTGPFLNSTPLFVF